MIERLRLNHYSWRTEQTYRDWAWRFGEFLGSKAMDEAGGDDIRRFLTELAVRGRVGKVLMAIMADVPQQRLRAAGVMCKAD
jgi:hypothetical protein